MGTKEDADRMDELFEQWRTLRRNGDHAKARLLMDEVTELGVSNLEAVRLHADRLIERVKHKAKTPERLAELKAKADEMVKAARDRASENYNPFRAYFR